MIKILNYNQSGQAFILSVVVLFLVLLNTIILLSGSLNFFNNSKYTVESLSATNLAEAGIDKAVATLNATGGSYNPNPDTEVILGNGSFTTSVTNINAGTKKVKVTGYVPNKDKPKAKKTIELLISKGTGISFVYGMLIGNGGIFMDNGSTINGSIYSNGNIDGGNNVTITGDTYVAGGTQPNADQPSSSYDCTDPNCGDFIFGKNVSGNNQLDIAQSFQPTSTQVINKVSLKLKKVGSPPNLTVRILGNSNNKPNKDNVLATGTLNANLVTTNYGFVDINFTTSPTLTIDNTYWIVVDTSSDNSNYWVWSQDLLQSYPRGSAAWSPNWQSNNPTWNTLTGDLVFRTYMGGVATHIIMNNGSRINGNVHANTISGVTIGKDAFYQVILNSVVGGSSHPGSIDPSPISMPISEGNITDWKNLASPPLAPEYGGITGCPSSIGPGKYNGNMTTGNNCTIIVKSPVWITGNALIGNSVIFRMDPSYGNSSGIMIIDGTTTFQNSDDLQGTGVNGSYLVLLSTYDSQINPGTAAIDTGNSSITGILYAPYGEIKLANGANFKEAVAWKIHMGNNTTLTYDSGLISTFFSSGPSGSFSVIKGTYQSK